MPANPQPDPPQGADQARLHIWVEGYVQGVGFRAFVAQNAQALRLTGWVRNVGWDAVETVAEGDRATLDRYLQIVKAGPRASHVDKTRVEWEEATGEFVYFDVRRSL